jgi:hypothetical protein
MIQSTCKRVLENLFFKSQSHEVYQQPLSLPASSNRITLKQSQKSNEREEDDDDAVVGTGGFSKWSKLTCVVCVVFLYSYREVEREKATDHEKSRPIRPFGPTRWINNQVKVT